MIEISAKNEDEQGFELQVKMTGSKLLLIDELVAVFNQIYHNTPEIFEKSLLLSQYTEDHI